MKNLHFAVAKKGSMLTFNKVKDDQGPIISVLDTLFECNVQILIILRQFFRVLVTEMTKKKKKLKEI